MQYVKCIKNVFCYIYAIGIKKEFFDRRYIHDCNRDTRLKPRDNDFNLFRRTIGGNLKYIFSTIFPV